MASRSLNKVMLIGRLGKDAETRYTQSGTAVTNFTLATNRRHKDQQTGEWQEDTDWHDIVLWKAENLANYGGHQFHARDQPAAQGSTNR